MKKVMNYFLKSTEAPKKQIRQNSFNPVLEEINSSDKNEKIWDITILNMKNRLREECYLHNRHVHSLAKIKLKVPIENKSKREKETKQ